MGFYHLSDTTGTQMEGIYHQEVPMGITYPFRIASNRELDISPQNLVQEKYRRDPWKMLVSVILIQRTKGGETLLLLIEE